MDDMEKRIERRPSHYIASQQKTLGRQLDVPSGSDTIRLPSALLPPLAALFDIHLRLETAMAAATICSTALKAQHADSDQDAALVLQRCACDALSVQIDRLGVVQGKLSKLV